MFEKNKEALILLNNDLKSINIPAGTDYKIPPPTFDELGGNFIDYKKGSELFVSFYAKKKYSNPQGTFQGGMIAACFDDTFGPLAILASKKPVVSIDMNIQYIRSVLLEETFYIKANVVSINRTMLFLRAEAFNSRMKLLAQASSNLLIYNK